MKNVLVTGANGQLGKTIEELFSENDYNLKFSFATRQDLDITNETEVKRFFKSHTFDYCINCAAYTNVEQAEKAPKAAFKVNAEGVKYLAETCKENQVVLIHISTDYVFDGEKASPYTVEDATNPINEYGRSKLLGEQYIQEVLDHYFIVRTSWLYSKKYGNNFYRTILKKAKTEKKLTITTAQTGCPTDTVSLSKFCVELIVKADNRFGIRHFSDGKAMSWYEFTKKILKDNNLLRKVSLVKSNKYITFARRPKFSVLK